ncbi:MAG: phospholipase [Planctomycetota bacterium]|nr:MAG: phospholipase [Planctomycetota bacterium]
MRYMTFTLLFFALLVPACRKKKSNLFFPPAGPSIGPGDHKDSIQHIGLTRTFEYHVPASWTYADEQPLVFALHGGGGNGDRMIALTQGGFDTLSESEGFIVVYPDAYEKQWNDGRGIEDYASHLYNVDDVGFLSTLIDYFDDSYNIDRKRVYATGISNGSFMSHRLGIEASDRFAAVAPVCGSLTENLSLLTPMGPIPILIMVGVEDPMVPFGGGDIVILGITGMGRVISAANTVNYWVSNNVCDPAPTVTWLPDLDPDDGTLVRRDVYGNGLSGSEVVYYEVVGGGHTWPGGWQYLGEWLVGKTCRDMDANTVIWDFFKTHSQ